MVKYLLAQDMEQNLLVPRNWLAGAKFLQYSHFNTGGKNRADKSTHYLDHMSNQTNTQYSAVRFYSRLPALYLHNDTILLCYAAFQSKPEPTATLLDGNSSSVVWKSAPGSNMLHSHQAANTVTVNVSRQQD